MDNATKALLIAGGMLLGILTLTALIVMFSNAAKIQKSQFSKEELERLAKWNAEWEAYNKGYLYGAEVLTVVKKAEQNNKDYSDTKYHVTIVVKDELGNDITGINELKEYLQGTATSLKRKTNIFSCVGPDGKEGIKYDEDTGRVNKMYFKFKE